MPLSLIPPRQGRSKNYSIRGTYLGVYVERSAGSPEKSVARKLLLKIKRDIESGKLVESAGLTFGDAATSYLKAGGSERFLQPIVDHFGRKPLAEIDHMARLECAETLYPGRSPATWSRQVFTPIAAVIHHVWPDAGQIKRPAGSLGKARVAWLEPEEVELLLEHCDKPLSALVVFLVTTGCRISEALSLTWRDVNLQRRFAYVGMTKNGEPRGVHLPESVVVALANLQTREEVMPDRYGDGQTCGPSTVHPDHDKATPPAVIVAPGAERDRRAAALARLEKARAVKAAQHAAARAARLAAGHVFPWADRFAAGKAMHEAFVAAAIPLPERTLFHLFRHTYGTWMRRYAGLDTRGLVGTGAWKSESAARRYSHVVASDEARRADQLPKIGRAKG